MDFAGVAAEGGVEFAANGAPKLVIAIQHLLSPDDYYFMAIGAFCPLPSPPPVAPNVLPAHF